MKKLLAFLILIASSFVLGITLVSPGIVLAQETPEEAAKKYNITFPIKELGNCTDYSSCRTYCEDPVNAETCTDFAKQKGFYKEADTGKAELLAKARSQLGCTSESSCREVCSKEENYEKCSNFAKQNNISGGHTDDPGNTVIIQKAKSVLGCSSESSCREVCSKEENRERCSQFAKQTGLRGGEHRIGPGGCTSEATCKAFCSDPTNYTVCKGYASSQGGQFSGPGGCDSEQSCKQYCQDNPEVCRNYGNSPAHNPEEMCQRTPNCSWANNTCNCTGFSSQTNPTGVNYGQDYCKTNPDKCQQNNSQPPSGTYSQPNSGSDPASECTRSGCYWVPGQSKCDCQNKPYENSETECNKSGCSWTGSSCNCSGSQTQTQSQQPQQQYQPQTFDYAAECSKQSGCSWNGSSCQCGGVQGASVNNTVFQRILDFLKFW